MTTFKTCSNGHNYDAGKYQVCPFCPTSVSNPDYEKTLIDFKKTQLLEEESNSHFAKTLINEENPDFKSTLASVNAQHPFKRTSIAGEEGKSSSPQQSHKRKLVGWLVTFSNDEYGQDYKLYMGKNKIGTASDCDIIINDPLVSGNHTTILFRDNKFLIKDNFSTNGTKINGASVDEGKLSDGDEIILGTTVFKIKTVFN
jgi:hypothetical protein